MSVGIVVAHHCEDLRWLRGLSGADVTVVTSSQLLPLVEGVEIRDVCVDNVGREAFKYLTYITQNYDNLPATVVFLQGDPNGHGDVLSTLHRHLSSSFAFIGQTTELRFRETTSLHDRWAWETMYDLFQGVIPSLQWGFGAQFVVSRETLRSRPLAWYQNLLCSCVTDQRAPWAFERLWKCLVGDIVLRRSIGFGSTSGPISVHTMHSDPNDPLVPIFRETLAAVEPSIKPKVHLLGDAESGANFNWGVKMRRMVRPARTEKGVVVWADTDVVFLRPFRERILSLMSNVDILFQSEAAFTNTINAGFFAFRASKKMARFFERMGAEDYTLRTDQGMLPDHLREDGIKWGVLPLEFGAMTHGWFPVLANRLRTFHATCISGKDATSRKILAIDALRARVC